MFYEKLNLNVDNIKLQQEFAPRIDPDLEENK